MPLAPAAAALLARLQDGPQRWGVHEPGAPVLSKNLHALEREIEFTFPFLLVYTDLTTPNVGDQLRAAAALDRTVELTLHAPREAPAAPPTYFYRAPRRSRTTRHCTHTRPRFGTPARRSSSG